ncbi:MAG TPA: MMPL family transporter [Acidimicrobiales bacterium]|nr:MMPL family transporter [Acidimicrobiales bacterium]
MPLGTRGFSEEAAVRLSTQSLARASSRRPWRTVGIWLFVLVLAGFFSGRLLKDATTEEFAITNNPEAQQAADLIEEKLRGPDRAVESFIVSSQTATVDDPAFRAYVERLQGELLALGKDVVEGVTTFYDTEDRSMVAGGDPETARTTVMAAVLAGDVQTAQDHADKLKAAVARAATPGFTTQLFGPASLNDDFLKANEENLANGEKFGIPAALLILIVVFGAVVAALLPILIGIAAIFVAVGLVAVVGQVWNFSFFVTAMISMMGLAVGIDYSLFFVSRYREERQRGKEKLAAIEAAGGTASRAVFFSGMTVVLALMGMLLIPNTIFRSLAGGAIFVVLVAVAASITLLPALLGLLGDHINRLRVHRRPSEGAGKQGGFWDVVTRAVMRRPVVSLLAGVGVLLVPAVFWTQMHTGFAGVTTLPESFESKRAFEALAKDFPGGMSSPVEIVVDAPADDPAVQSGVERLQASLATDPFLGPSQVEVNAARDLTLVSAPLKGDPSSDAAVEAIERVRDDYVPQAFPEGTPGKVVTGGDTAFNKDFFEITSEYMPLVFAFVLGLSFILLTVAFRSVVVPLKAILLNLLSVAAAYGLIVLVFQKGVGNDLFGFQKVEAIEAWLPLFLFSVLFGLSMDYHVFLLSRVREHYDQTGDNTESVAYGLRTTAGIITGAALIMVAVFIGFAQGELVSFQQMGFGLAAAVLIDATIVRSILVPASMKLLGKRNWYLPRWLEWLPKVQVEGPREERPTEPPAQPVPAGAPTGTG